MGLEGLTNEDNDDYKNGQKAVGLYRENRKCITLFCTFLRPGSDAAQLVPNLTDELSTAKERRLNQFGTAVR